METEVGRVTHYFSKVGVAILEITAGSLKVGDTIRIVGHTSDFTQTVDSMQIEHQSVTEGQTGQSIGVKVVNPVREHDKVYTITP